MSDNLTWKPVTELTRESTTLSPDNQVSDVWQFVARADDKEAGQPGPEIVESVYVIATDYGEGPFGDLRYSAEMCTEFIVRDANGEAGWSNYQYEGGMFDYYDDPHTAEGDAKNIAERGFRISHTHEIYGWDGEPF